MTPAGSTAEAVTPGQIAAREFAQRRAWLAREVAARRLAPAEAEARLRPWLHAAAMAGAEIAAVFEDGLAIFPFDRAGEKVRLPMSLFLSADDRHVARAEVLAACNAEIAASESDPRRIPHARQLLQLAGHLGARAWMAIA